MAEIVMEPRAAIESLLASAGCGPDTLARAIRRIGLTRVADIVTDEIIVRADPPGVDGPVAVRLEITDGAEVASRGLAVDRKGISVVPGRGDDVTASVRFDVVDIVECLYGRSENRHPVTRDVTWSEDFFRLPAVGPRSDPADSRASLERFRQLSTAVHTVLAACATGPCDLGALAVRYGSDKWSSFHWYTEHYQRHFARYRTEPVRLLEIGIGGYGHPGWGGESLRMWQRYFGRGLIYGLDIFDKSEVTGPRIRAIQGDQNDPDFLAELGRRFGPFDIVIDDGSHVSEHVRTSLRALFPFVRPGGLYVVEDLQTAYWPEFGGNEDERLDADTSIGLLKKLVDGLNHQDIPSRNGGPPSYFDRHTAGLHFYHNLAIVEKGLNVEDPLPSFIREMAREMSEDPV